MQPEILYVRRYTSARASGAANLAIAFSRGSSASPPAPHMAPTQGLDSASASGRERDANGAARPAARACTFRWTRAGTGLWHSRGGGDGAFLRIFMGCLPAPTAARHTLLAKHGPSLKLAAPSHSLDAAVSRGTALRPSGATMCALSHPAPQAPAGVAAAISAAATALRLPSPTLLAASRRLSPRAWRLRSPPPRRLRLAAPPGSSTRQFCLLRACSAFSPHLAPPGVGSRLRGGARRGAQAVAGGWVGPMASSLPKKAAARRRGTSQARSAPTRALTSKMHMPPSGRTL